MNRLLTLCHEPICLVSVTTEEPGLPGCGLVWCSWPLYGHRDSACEDVDAVPILAFIPRPNQASLSRPMHRHDNPAFPIPTIQLWQLRRFVLNQSAPLTLISASLDASQSRRLTKRFQTGLHCLCTSNPHTAFHCPWAIGHI